MGVVDLPVADAVHTARLLVISLRFHNHVVQYNTSIHDRQDRPEVPQSNWPIENAKSGLEHAIEALRILAG